MDNHESIIYIMGALAPTNYYNNDQRIIRIMIPHDDQNRYYDFPLLTSGVMPNPDHHIALIMTTESVIDSPKSYFFSKDKRYDLPPGLRSVNTVNVDSGFGWVYLIDKHITSNITELNDTSAGMFNSNTGLPNDPKKVRMSLSPSLPYSYTTSKEDYSDKNLYQKENIGVFVMDDGIFIKGPSSGMFLGDKGTSFLGTSNFTSSKNDYGIQTDNPFVGWCPPSIMTAPLTIDKIPNINAIVAMANVAKNLASVMKATGSAAQTFSKLK